MLSLILVYITICQARVLYRYNLTEIDERAVCNDGSSAVLYTTKSNFKLIDTDYWVLFLEGGYWCYDSASCEERWRDAPHYMTSTDKPERMTFSGFLNDNHNIYPKNAHVSYISYCTSDAYIGDFTYKTDNGLDLQFRGNRVTLAAIKFLTERGLGRSGTPQTLLFSGCSAGGRGASLQLEQVRGKFEGSNVNVLGVFDSAFWLDVEPLDVNVGSFGQQVKRFTEMSNWGEIEESILLRECLSSYEGESWKCIMGEYYMHFVSPPYFLTSSQYDSFQIDHNLGGYVGKFYDEKVDKYLRKFRERHRKLFSRIEGSGSEEEILKNSFDVGFMIFLFRFGLN